MAILDYGNLSINGTVISYEGAVKIEAGSKKRIVNPQINGGKIITTDITTNVSKITVKVRVTPESNDQFDAFFNNGDNNTISFRDQNFSGCLLEMLPEREDLSTVDYVFLGDPAI
jgi:hypothetical protein